MYWLQYADFYDWPHIQYFDDYQDLKHKLLNSDFKYISDAMKKELMHRKQQVTVGWCKVIDNIRNRRNTEMR